MLLQSSAVLSESIQLVPKDSDPEPFEREQRLLSGAFGQPDVSDQIPVRQSEQVAEVSHFENSHYNPHNPDPEALVRFGLHSEQEMVNMRVKFERVDLGE